MINSQIYTLTFCCIGAIQALILSLYFLSDFSKKKQTHRILLGLVLLAIAIRVTKSTLYLIGELPLILMNIGFAAHLAIGPLLLLYLLTYSRSNHKIYWFDFIHFIPAGLVLVLSNHLTETNFWLVGGYTWALYLSLLYLPVVFVTLLKNSKNFNQNQIWFWGLSIAVSIFIFAYFANYILRITNYSTAPVINAGLIYFISFLILRRFDFFKQLASKDEKYKYINLSTAALQSYGHSIEKALKDERCFLKSDFSLKELSNLTNIPTHILSYVIGNQFGTKFNDLINEKRIVVAKELIINNDHLKISAIATDCGFNSISSFNTAFKKFTGTTPSNFRNTHHEVSN